MPSVSTRAAAATGETLRGVERGAKIRARRVQCRRDAEDKATHRGGRDREHDLLLGLEGLERDFGRLDDDVVSAIPPMRLLLVEDNLVKQADLPAGGDAVSARRPLMGNQDVILGLSRPTQSMTYAYRNAQAYETWFTHEGSGVLESRL